MTDEERDLTLEYLKEMQEKYIEGYGYEAHPLPEWYALDEAIKALEPKPMEKFEDVKTHIQRLAGDYKCWDNRLTWEEALELNRMLEAQPCEDCVNRSELQRTMDSLPLFRFVNNDHEEADDYYNCESVDMVIRNLPSVTPKYTDEEIDKAQAVEQAYVDKMVELAVKETERPKGKWIKCKSRFGTEYFKCSECGRKLNWIDSDDNYCNSCGSDNSESTKELYKEKLAEISGGGEDV